MVAPPYNLPLPRLLDPLDLPRLTDRRPGSLERLLFQRAQPPPGRAHPRRKGRLGRAPWAQGTVKGVRQVAVRFSAPMVIFGDPRLPEPFQIECPAKGRTRWADTRNWVFECAPYRISGYNKTCLTSVSPVGLNSRRPGSRPCTPPRCWASGPMTQWRWYREATGPGRTHGFCR